jgi:hypothetical protein
MQQFRKGRGGASNPAGTHRVGEYTLSSRNEAGSGAVVDLL